MQLLTIYDNILNLYIKLKYKLYSKQFIRIINGIELKLLI